MSFVWTSRDDLHARLRGFALYLTEALVNGRLAVVYAMQPDALVRAKAAAEQGDEVAQKALTILTQQRMKE